MAVRRELELEGFISQRCAHEHLLKHVLRLTDQSTKSRRDKSDPERWEKLIEDPPLAAKLAARRKAALAIAGSVEGCAVGELSKPTSEKVCEGCQNRAALRVVTREMKTLLDAYTDVARDTLAARHQSPQLSMAYQSDRGPTLEVTDSRKVVVVVGLDQTLSKARVVTCYRSSDSLKQQASQYGRHRAAWGRRGKLLEGE